MANQKPKSGFTYYGIPVTLTDAEIICDLSRSTLKRIKKDEGITECKTIKENREKFLKHHYSHPRTFVLINGKQYSVREAAEIKGVSSTLIRTLISEGITNLDDNIPDRRTMKCIDDYADKWEETATSSQLPSADELVEEWRALREQGKYGEKIFSQLSMKTGNELEKMIDSCEEILKRRMGKNYVDIREGKRIRKMRHVGKKVC